MTDIENIQQYIIEKSSSIDGYLGAMLIGSMATGFINESSDIDIHVFVDQTQKKSSIGGDSLHGRTISIIIYPINMVLQRIENTAKNGSYVCKRMYDIQGLILDDPYMIVKNIKENAQTTAIERGYTESELRFSIGGLNEFQRILETLNPYAIDKLLFHIFDQYSFCIGYDHYSEFSLSFWKVAHRIFEDDIYALQHRGKIYPDKEFIKLRIQAYNNRTIENINQLLTYSREKLIELL